MTSEYDAIFIGGNKHLSGGRILAGYRLRTEGRKQGYETLVIDTAPSMTYDELMLLLENVTTKKTLIFGFSIAWIDAYNPLDINWIDDRFFNELKSKFPNIKFVCGGPGNPWIVGSHIIHRNCDWSLIGFSDVSYTKLLDMFSGKPNHGLKYFVDTDTGKKVVQSDINHKITNPNDIETVLDLEDGFLSYQPIPLEVSRGCIFRCSFCSHPFQGAKDYDSYQRTSESLANELKRNYEYFGTTRYSLMDDTFNDSMEKLDRLHKAIDIAKLPDFKFMSYLKPELLVTKPEMIDKLKSLGIAAGYVGLESMNNASRKIVKKGMDFGRVADSIKLLKQKTNVKLEASFIIGLPEDTIENQHNTLEYMIQNQNEFCATWMFQPLGIYNDKHGKGNSDIDNNPNKFGYEIISSNNTLNHEGSFVHWKNNNMDGPTAKELAMNLNVKSRSIRKLGGWSVPTAWHLGISETEIESKTVMDLKIPLESVASERNRAIEFLNKYIGKSYGN
jgi:hypothetical protein